MVRPIGDVLQAGFHPDKGHGWSWPPLKASKPVEASVNLNEWIRFDQPGDYTIKVTSLCVSEGPGRGALFAFRNDHAANRSGVAGMAERKIPSRSCRDLELFDQPLPQAQPGESSQAQAEHRDELFENARDDLKYLATPAAIAEMTLRLRERKVQLRGPVCYRR